jgi:hypothetical protein
MINLINNKFSCIIFTVFYIFIEFLIILQNTISFIDTTLSVGAQYGVIFIINSLSAMLLIGIYYLVFNFIFRFIVDSTYNNFSELYNILVLTNIIQISINYGLYFLNIENIFISIFTVLICNMLPYFYYANMLYAKSRLLIIYAIICTFESLTIFLGSGIK